MAANCCGSKSEGDKGGAQRYDEHEDPVGLLDSFARLLMVRAVQLAQALSRQ